MAHVHALRCRECGREYDVAPIFTCEWCFGPLEVTYDYDAIRASVSRESIAAGPLSIWRYADLLPVERNPAVDLGAGFTPARARRPPRGRARPRRGVDQERHHEPDELVQGPRHRGRAVEGARVRLQGRGVRVDRQPRQRGRGPRRARRAALVRVRPRQPRAGQDRHDRGLRRQRRRDRRQLRRREPPLRRARGHLPVGVRQRERAHVLRRGLQDARVRDRRAARLADPRPRGGAGGERLAAHQDPQGLRRAAHGRPARRGARRSASAAPRRSGARRSRRRGSASPTRSSR